MNRWLYAAGGILILLFLGLIYAWSVFVGPLESEFGWQRSETSLIFSISMATFCLGGLLGGFLAKRVSCRIVMIVSAAFILIGFNMASAITSLMGLYISYGGFCGFGVGMGYNSVMNSVMRWFPDKQGILSGVLLMGFGFGGSVFGSLAVYMMQQWGWRLTFRLLGIALGVLLVLWAVLIRLPTLEEISALQQGKKGSLSVVTDTPTAQMVRDPSYIAYFFWATLLGSVGLAIIGNAASMAGSLTAELGQATFVAGLVSMFNGFGRLLFGFLLDGIGSKRCIRIITIGLALGILFIGASIFSQSLLMLGAAFAVTGLFYGGVTPANSAYIGKVFGQKYYSMNFGVTNMVLLIAAFLGPYSAGVIQTRSGGFMGMVAMLLVFCALALPLTLFIKKNSPGRQKEKMPNAAGLK